MIYVNGRFLTQEVTGVQRFAIQILLNLIKIRDDIVVLCPKTTPDNEITKAFNIKRIGRLSGQLWEQTELFLFMVRNGNVLLSFCNTAPIGFFNNIIVHHDITYRVYPKSYSLGFRFFYRIFSPWLLKRGKKIITVSDFSRNEIERAYGIENIDVVNNAATEVFFPRKITEPDNPYILCVSSPSVHKNFKLIIDSFEKINKSLGLELKIVGASNRNFSTVTYSAVSNNSYIKYYGRVTDEELAVLYSGAFAFVFPSLYEGFGIPLLEAQSCGCPVIASNTASMPEVLNDSALYFSPTCSESLISQIEKLYHDGGLRDSLIKRGFENAKRFNWLASANKINNILEGYAKDKPWSD
ncbi:Mannosylfructose-phosphate synthase [Serratia marcescens]|uniref:glycosyltransferase family 4 protein n=1 Tax=Serratia marcescens TaxID=615 RepID=UPI0021799961|nr:glycosyltransferase family 1 protein [Serratia marcescens]CAI0765414.1 Mannosylfructose-phosphate synthase [Serratia marcescens]CAI0979481.1 Mannosylfructose-phosphate synthase [Serratia marcescens]CAI1634685.1 Mannosylfructose-phosphate synthase [Serratia marcescens]CAI1749154.1 Mannosylfructose-phosphate synthase [Serratia marcescens]